MISHEPGSEIAGYRIESLVGRGGMAVVYRAEDLRLGRKVALKLLSPQLADSEQFRQRFIQESRLAASLDHPNIIPIYEAGEADGQLFIAMRYVQGSDLKGLVTHGGPLPVEWTLRLFGQIGDALDAAHRAGLVHRDVKPANILVATREHTQHAHNHHVYLTDFGVTKRTTEMSGGLTGTGHFLGTADYVSPEQIQGKPVGPATDIYALGCMLYECLTGQLPYLRDDDAALLWAHLVEPPPPITATRPELPAAVNAVVRRAMAKDPADRYQSCQELVGALELALGMPTPEPAPGGRPAVDRGEVTGLAEVASDSGNRGTGPGTRGPGGRHAASMPAGTSGRRRSPRTLGVAAVALAVLATVLVATVLGSRSSPSGSSAAAGPTATGASSVPAPAPTPTPTPSPTSTPSPTPAVAVGVFSGLTSGVGLSFALDGGNATAYVCDGRKFEVWMQGTVTGDQVTMTGPDNATLTGVVDQQQLSGRIVTPQRGEIDFLALQARPPAGVYKAEIEVNGQDAYLGWAVLPDGTQLGAVRSGQSVTPAPPLTIDVTTAPVSATFSLNGTSYRAEVVQAGEPLWLSEPSPTP
jgi:serine/threonine protein kinase